MDKNRLWGRLIRHHRISRQETVTIENDDIEEAFLEICRRFDVQRPLQLPKHNREFEKFGRTPLVRINKLNDSEAVVYAKVESFNPLSKS